MLRPQAEQARTSTTLVSTPCRHRRFDRDNLGFSLVFAPDCASDLEAWKVVLRRCRHWEAIMEMFEVKCSLQIMLVMQLLGHGWRLPGTGNRTWKSKRLSVEDLPCWCWKSPKAREAPPGHEQHKQLPSVQVRVSTFPQPSPAPGVFQGTTGALGANKTSCKFGRQELCRWLQRCIGSSIRASTFFGPDAEMLSRCQPHWTNIRSCPGHRYNSPASSGVVWFELDTLP